MVHLLHVANAELNVKPHVTSVEYKVKKREEQQNHFTEPSRAERRRAHGSPSSMITPQLKLLGLAFATDRVSFSSAFAISKKSTKTDFQLPALLS